MAGDAKEKSPMPHISSSVKHISKRVVASYIFDWLVIFAIVGGGAGLSRVTPNQRAFSLTDQSISYLYKPNTVSVAVLAVICLIGPAAIIFLLTLLIPVPQHKSSTANPLKPGLLWRRRFWTIHTSWLGLALALSLTLLSTEGLKDLTGKPRPDLLSRCKPDLSLLDSTAISGLGDVLPGAPRLVTARICRTRGDELTHDGFASWPSGHTSFAWCGMLYLSLWLASHLGMGIPLMASRLFHRPGTCGGNGFDVRQGPGLRAVENDIDIPLRNQAAAPPVWGVLVVLAPVATAAFVGLSRYTDNRHAGFDIISGAVLGAGWAWVGFRWFHGPVGKGVDWGARSRGRAWWRGEGGWVGDEGWGSSRAERSAAAQKGDVETAMGNGGVDDAGVGGSGSGSGSGSASRIDEEGKFDRAANPSAPHAR